jgi:hypothetical protein
LPFEGKFLVKDQPHSKLITFSYLIRRELFLRIFGVWSEFGPKLKIFASGVFNLITGTSLAVPCFDYLNLNGVRFMKPKFSDKILNNF